MSTVNILAVGDVVSSRGCEFLYQHLPTLKKLKNIDIVIVNGENSADGNGIHRKSCQQIFDCGADVVTGGNHTFRRNDIYERLDTDNFLLRPANYPDSAPGKGYTILDKGSYKVAVINLMGVVYLENLRCPYETADELIEKAKADGAKIIIVDFHAEATAEKKALGFYLDGKISALFGTHTHIQTADEQILPNGTGYITDIGMTGPTLSVLGVAPELAIRKQKDKIPVKFEYPNTPIELNGVLFSVDKETGRTVSVERIIISE